MLISPSDVAPLATGGDVGFGVYVHWPFCASKCPYCDFNSHVRSGAIDQHRYLAAFRREIHATRERTGPRHVSSIFFGGGTPSLMTPETVGGILEEIGRNWHIERHAEITLEANPSSVEAARFNGYRAAGINRVSLGVQALNDPALKALGRLHSVAEAKAAIDIARSIFKRFTFDLIYARPGQGVGPWCAELREALELAGDHLSLYQLTIEPDTPFEKLHKAGKLLTPEPELADELFAATQAMMAEAGLPAYEISNHARPGQESRHNVLYWRYGEYAGIGPGAHGRILVDGQRRATVTERAPEAWLARVERDAHGVVEDLPLARDEQADEMLLMGLRLSEGLDLARLSHIGGVRPSTAAINHLIDLEMLDYLPDEDRIRATARGRFVLNKLVENLSDSFEDVGGE
jgi:putative oxygen-independent coproporphyrinogen III oxidase